MEFSVATITKLRTTILLSIQRLLLEKWVQYIFLHSEKQCHATVDT